MTDSADGARPACITDEWLAKYVDGKVTGDERTRLQAHPATCEYCYALLGEVLRTTEDVDRVGGTATTGMDVEQGSANRVISMPRKAGPLVVLGGLLAAAAAIVLYVNVQRSPLDPLVSVVGAERLTVARPTGGFHYGPLRSTLRGAGTDHLALRAAEGELHDRAATGSVDERHALGVAQLLLGNETESVRTLEAVVAAAPDVAAHHADLGAARLSQFLQDGRPEDAEAALASLDRALALDSRLSEIQFNRALLLGAVGRRGDAIAAWDAYLALDSESGWAEEARRQRETLSAPASR